MARATNFILSDCCWQANGGTDGVPPLLLHKEQDRKKQQKEASLMRIAECGSSYCYTFSHAVL
jgi:hypothetical protein